MLSKEIVDNDRHRSERLLSMGQIAAGIAHEVKNPLTSVKGFLQLLREKYQDDFFTIAESELDNAIAIITDFLKVTKPEMDDESYQVVNVAAELEAVLNLFLDRQYRISVIKNFRDTKQTIYAKKNQIKRALFNILKNAFESISSDTGIVRVSHYVEHSQLVIIIEDTGVGIHEDKISMLGTPFFTTKDEGTGMGLSQVYSTVYGHGGTVHVQSTLGVGTQFSIYLPIESKEERPLTEIDVIYSTGLTLQGFVEANQERFRDHLLSNRPEIASTLLKIKEESGVDLVNNALILVELTLGNHPHELALFANKEGKLWAKHSLQVSFKLEWIETIKRVLWDYIYNYYRVQETNFSLTAFFELERSINSTLDSFLTHFTISYNQFKDELLQSQRELVENLSVPIIPLTKTVSIVPLIGTIDTFRAVTVQEKVLRQIELDRIETMIIDLSGVTYLDTAVLNHLFHLFDGIEMMGCKAIVTGIRAEIASVLVKTGLSMGHNVIKKGNLQQALEILDLQH
ncbi:ATP-binding protein [Alicyclobacillus ferrooxydans]|uniref:histidine kinase n=1 Tax=Alicyclobacillus ferrooxydans TaxID=471514 RepID=A0A0P9CGC1_9BACL|nr:ATP-binding protein [Alicyclobacillus ferrooxydans]KPV42075.1 hypothetical protein AN477_20040 [Alicyclobacillus ferrooxydans]